MTRRMLAPINTVKHYFHLPAVAITASATSVVILVDTVAKGAARAAAVDVEEGAVVKAVFCEFWISGVTADKTATWCILKRPANVAGPTFAEMANLGSYPNKKNILNAGQGLAPTGGNVMNIYKGWLAIPKGKQRFGLDDKLTLVVAAVGTNVNLCGMVTFKEYE